MEQNHLQDYLNIKSPDHLYRMSTDNENETSNETVDSENYDAHQILQIISLLGIIIVGVILNCTVLLVFFGSRVVRNTKSNLCIINLVICDMIFLAIVIPMSFISVAAPRSEVAYTVTHGPLCQTTGFLSVLVCTASSLTLACIAVERYFAAVHPLHYVRLFKQRQCLAVLTVCWVWAALTAIPPLLPSKPASFIYHPGTKRCSPSLKSDCWYFWYCVLMGYGIPLPIMTICYVKISIKIRNHRRKVFGIKTRTNTKTTTTTVLRTTAPLPQGRSTTDDPQVQKGSGIFHTPIMVTPTGTESDISTNQIPTKDTNRPQVQIAKRGALLVVAYFSCWGPYAFLNSCDLDLNVDEWIEVMSMWIVYTLVIWNPLIYVFNNKQFRYELNKVCFIKKVTLRCW